MNKKLITKKVMARLSIKTSKTEEQEEAEQDAIQENKEELIKFIAKELNKKGFKASVDLDSSYIFLDVQNKKGDKFYFSEDGVILKEDSGYVVLYNEDSKKNFEVKFELNDKLDFKNVDLSKLIQIIK
jgi:stress response protein SCP2